MELKELAVEEINLILQSLAKQPYETVSVLIAKVKDQGEAQLKAKQEQEQAPVEKVEVEVVQ